MTNSVPSNHSQTLTIIFSIVSAVGACFGGGFWFREIQKTSDLAELNSKVKALELENKTLKNMAKTQEQYKFNLPPSTKIFSEYNLYYNFNNNYRQVGVEMLLTSEAKAQLAKADRMLIKIIIPPVQKMINLCLWDTNENEDCRRLSTEQGIIIDPSKSERSISILLSDFRKVNIPSVAKISFDAKNISPSEPAGKQKAGFTITKIDFVRESKREN